MSSSAKRQCARVTEFFDNGIEMKIIRPTSSGYASQHSKSWLIDGELLLTGSPNTTHGGMDHNMEQLYRITCPSCVQDVSAAIEELWQRGEKVDATVMGSMREKWEKREQDKKFQRPSRSLSRSLTPAFDTAGNDSSGAVVS